MSTKKTAKKTKNVLIISASFRPNSNSHALCQEVAKGVKAAGNKAEVIRLAKGVKAAGNKAEVIRLKDKKIGFCTGCYACQKLGKCVIQDDANAIVEKICKADAVVFGTPVYYFSIAGQLKALFDRCVAKWPEPNGKPYYLVATMAENMDWDLVKAPLQGFVDCFDGAKIKGFLKAGGVYEPGAVKKTKFMKAAFDLGRRI